MSETARVLLVMWFVYGVGIVAIARKDAGEATGFGIIVGIVLAIATAKIL